MRYFLETVWCELSESGFAGFSGEAVFRAVGEFPEKFMHGSA